MADRLRVSYAAVHGVPALDELAARFPEVRTRVAAAAHRTPVLTSRTLDARTGAEVYFKCENLQRMGAFKFRGAWNMISRLSAADAPRGVISYSSGNHAQAVALVARELGLPALIVMPETAPRAKLEATTGYGAQVQFYDPMTDTREGLATRLAAGLGLKLVPPFDHPDIVLGQGTAAAELFEDAPPLDALLVPLGGGGLLSGSAIAAAIACPGCRVIGCEPAGADDGARSFRSGRLEVTEHPETIADGARTRSLSDLTLALIRRHVHDVVTVDDEQLRAALVPLWERLKLVVEPTGALGFAALLAGRVDLRGKRVGVVISGGNLDLASVAGWAAS